MRPDPGYVADARSLSEILALFEAEGFTAQLGARPGGMIVCFDCHTEAPAKDFELSALARTEGASDPDDMLAVAALTCRSCDAKGVLVLNYGPEATEEEAQVLLALEGLDKRRENPT